MKTRFTTAFAVVCFCFMAVSGCKGKDSAATPNTCEAASKRAEALSPALQAYSTDPTPAKCQAVKKAYSDFLDAAKNCTTVSKADIDAAQKSMNDFCR